MHVNESKKVSLKALGISLILAVAGGVLSVLVWDKVPEPMPVHWNAEGVADGFMPRIYGLSMIPALTFLLPLLILGLTRIDPRKEKVNRSSNALGVLIGTLSAFLFAIHGLMVRAAMHMEQLLHISSIFLLVGALFIVIGNMMPKFGSNFFIGIRTPWSLSDEKIWAKTQRLGGGLFVAAGIATCVMVLLGLSMKLLFPLFMVITLCVAIVPIVYSWMLWREGQGHV